MIFSSIPKNGSSWRNSLLYELDVEGDDPQNVEVSIINAQSNEVLATQNLYGVSQCSIDIAPYVVEHVSLAPVVTSSPSLHLSPSAIAVKVVANGVTSDVRVFFRESFDGARSQILTCCRDRQEVFVGDVVRMTIYALSNVRVQIQPILSNNSVVSPIRLSIATKGMPVELVVPTSSLSRGASSFTMIVQCDKAENKELRYVVASETLAPKRVVWYNVQGGVETYAFKHAIRQCLDVQSRSFDSEKFVIHREAAPMLMYRLCTGCETRAEIERIMEIFLSPAIYRCDGEGCYPLLLRNREVSFDAKGNLHTLSLDVEQPWKGGVQW